MEFKGLPEAQECASQLEEHFESALFDPRSVTDDPEGAVALVQFALVAGDRARAHNVVARLEALSVCEPSAERLACAAAYCRGLLDCTPPRHLNGAMIPVPDTPDRQGTKNGRARYRPSFGWDSLSAMELRISNLVAEGLTNRQVASEVIVSRHTVDSHLRHIFRKLGISSRVQLAREVIERRRQG